MTSTNSHYGTDSKSTHSDASTPPPATHSRSQTPHTTHTPRPVPPVVESRGRSQIPYTAYTTYVPTVPHTYNRAPLRRIQYDKHGNKSYSYMRDVSPPRHRNELPRRNPSFRYRDVSPLGTSRFEQPFRRTCAGREMEVGGNSASGGVGSVRWEAKVGSNFTSGGIGEWEHY